MTTSLNDLTPAPENTKWELTWINALSGDYQARLMSKLNWEILGTLRIDGTMSKYKAKKATREFLEDLGFTIESEEYNAG